jgi:hypothetical protein
MKRVKRGFDTLSKLCNQSNFGCGLAQAGAPEPVLSEAEEFAPLLAGAQVRARLLGANL